MEYMAMLEVPGTIAGLLELINDPEPSVIKRTIRVFTNVYRHSLSLLAAGELDPLKFEKSYSEVLCVSNKLIGLLTTAENEGVVLHLVRYLEAALVSHILSDLSKFPHIAKMTAPMLKKGVDALLDLVNTPYVGGSAFCVAVRALFTVACYQVDMRDKVTEVAESLIDSPPPNLFDHNVRSFHKTLQRNLFRLLKRAELNYEKERLIDLMVRVGVPRKRLYEWAPRVSKKRSAAAILEDRIIYGRHSPPTLKKSKLSESDIIRRSPPHISTFKKQESILPLVPTIGDGSKSFSRISSLRKNIKNANVDPSAVLDQILSAGIVVNGETKMTRKNSPMIGNTALNLSKSPQLAQRSSPLTEVSNVLLERQHEHRSPSVTKENTPERLTDARSNSPDGNHSPVLCDLNNPNSKITFGTFFKNIISSNTNLLASKNLSISTITLGDFFNKCSPSEKFIHENLSTEVVVDLIISSLNNLPEEKPKYIPSIQLEPVEIMRQNVSVKLALAFKENHIAVLNAPNNIAVLNAPNSISREIKVDDARNYSPVVNIPNKLENDLTNKSNTIDLFASEDVDLRKTLFLNPPACSLPSVQTTQSSNTNRDPRVKPSKPTPALIINDSNLHLLTNIDPRLQKSDNSDPRLRRNRSPPSTATIPSLFTQPPPLFSCPPPAIASSSRDSRMLLQQSNTSFPNNFTNGISNLNQPRYVIDNNRSNTRWGSTGRSYLDIQNNNVFNSRRY